MLYYEPAVHTNPKVSIGDVSEDMFLQIVIVLLRN